MASTASSDADAGSAAAAVSSVVAAASSGAGSGASAVISPTASATLPASTRPSQEKVLLDDLCEADGCSVDEYATALERVLSERMRLCQRVQAKLAALKQQLASEEALSARVKKVPIF